MEHIQLKHNKKLPKRLIEVYLRELTKNDIYTKIYKITSKI